jgi:hypothetical protein
MRSAGLLAAPRLRVSHVASPGDGFQIRARPGTLMPVGPTIWGAKRLSRAVKMSDDDAMLKRLELYFEGRQANLAIFRAPGSKKKLRCKPEL